MEGDTKKQHYRFFSVVKTLAPEAKQARGKKEPKPDNHVLWGVWSKAAIASCKHGPGFSHPCKSLTGCWGLITGFVWVWPQAYLKCVTWQNSELSGLVMERWIVGEVYLADPVAGCPQRWVTSCFVTTDAAGALWWGMLLSALSDRLMRRWYCSVSLLRWIYAIYFLKPSYYLACLQSTLEDLIVEHMFSQGIFVKAVAPVWLSSPFWLAVALYKLPVMQRRFQDKMAYLFLSWKMNCKSFSPGKNLSFRGLLGCVKAPLK